MGQYEDEELAGCYYNRFRYYDSESGVYLAKDPIGLAGNNPNVYAYVRNSTTQVDVFGLDIITVYRFDTRSPSIIFGDGGFYAKAPGAKVDLAEYAAFNKASQYISTSHSLESALDFGNTYHGGNGYVYKIDIDDAKGLDVNKVLGIDSPFPHEKEFAVIDKISNNEITGYSHASNIKDASNVHWNYP